jgi:hypothetical protein
VTFFSSIFFCSFLDHGPNTLDYFSVKDYTENPDLTAVRLMTKTTMLVKEDEKQALEEAIVDQLSGPDVFPLDPNYRMIWYTWLTKNRFLSDPRVLEKGTLTGIYCIFEKKHENVIRESLKIIEDTFKGSINNYKDIESIIRKIINLDKSNKIEMKHYQALQLTKNSGKIVKTLKEKLEQNMKNKEASYSPDKYSTETKTFKIILEKMIFRKNAENEITSQKEKRKVWKSLITDLDKLILEKNPNINLKKLSERQIRLVFNQLAEAKIWKKLPIKTDIPSISSSSIAQFFLYYWLAHHKLLNNEEILTNYMKISGMVSIRPT